MITIVAGGKSCTFSDYGKEAPEAFQQLDRQIIATLDRIRWPKLARPRGRPTAAGP